MFLLKKYIIKLKIIGKKILCNEYLCVNAIKQSMSGTNVSNAKPIANFLSICF